MLKFRLRTLVNFLLILENIIEYSKKEIDKGYTPQKIYELCCCIREAFCLSYSIRKSNNLYIYFQENHLLLSFIGKYLRYLGPDERSQALLLLKALEEGIKTRPKVEAETIKSTPGIYCTKFLGESSFFNYLENVFNGTIYLIIDGIESNEGELVTLFVDKKTEAIQDTNLYIIPTYPISAQKSGFINGFKEMKNINFLSLSNIKSIENKILYINFRKDNQETH